MSKLVMEPIAYLAGYDKFGCSVELRRYCPRNGKTPAKWCVVNRGFYFDLDGNRRLASSEEILSREFRRDFTFTIGKARSAARKIVDPTRGAE